MATAGVACGVGLVVAVIEREAVATLAVDAVRFALNYPSRTRRAQTQDDQTPFARVAASQLGYGPLMQKRFTSPRAFTSFRVIDESTGSSVFSGGAPAASVHHGSRSVHAGVDGRFLGAAGSWPLSHRARRWRDQLSVRDQPQRL